MNVIGGRHLWKARLSRYGLVIPIGHQGRHIHQNIQRRNGMKVDLPSNLKMLGRYIDLLQEYLCNHFSHRFRISPELAEMVLGQIGAYLQHGTGRNMALSPNEQLLLALR